MNFRSVRDLNEAILRGSPAVPHDVDLIAGIPRSGMLAAGLLSLHLNLPLTDLDGLLQRRPAGCGPRGAGRGCTAPGRGAAPRHALVLDDSVLGGGTMAEARRRVAESGLDARVTWAAVYVAPESRGAVDLAFEEIVGPRVFEWNLMHGGMIGRSCVDIDGVLCEDPTEHDNDDGPRYRRFLQEARPHLCPTAPVGRLVTCRLEKYRDLTERWLARHGIRYGALHMLDLPDKAARTRAGCHAAFKSHVYRTSGAELFIESSAVQAAEIAHRAGRPVLCIETRTMHYPSLAAAVPIIVRRAPSLARRLARHLRRQVLGFDPLPGMSLQLDILMVTCDRPQYTRQSLDALLASCGESMRVWVWHNGGDAATLDVINQRRDHPDLVRVHHSAENRLLRDPINWLIAEADGDLLALVNDDCVVSDGWSGPLRAAHRDAPDLGVVACWHFRPEDFDARLAAAKTRTLPGGHQVLCNPWVQGSGVVFKRACTASAGGLRPSERGFTPYCMRLAAAGWVNGWYLPLVPIDHMDDPRSPRTLLRSDGDLVRHMPLSARHRGTLSIAEWDRHLRASARRVLEAPSDPRLYVGLRKRIRRLVTRLRGREVWY